MTVLASLTPFQWFMLGAIFSLLFDVLILPTHSKTTRSIIGIIMVLLFLVTI